MSRFVSLEKSIAYSQQLGERNVRVVLAQKRNVAPIARKGRIKISLKTNQNI